jgi:hypothetical protein
VSKTTKHAAKKPTAKKAAAAKRAPPKKAEPRDLFVAEYLIDLNATKAAIRAGYSERTAGQAGYRLLKNVQVAEAIAKALEEQQTRTLITADQVLLDIQRIGNLALSDKDFAQALRSRELLGKRYKLFTDKVEVISSTPRAERLREARERRAKQSA